MAQATYDDDPYGSSSNLWDEPQQQPQQQQAVSYDSHDAPGSGANPQQFTTDNKRWSFHLANDPYGGAAGAWSKQFYDNPGIDPGAAIQNQISAFRRQWGDAAPEDDIGVMEMIASGRQPSMAYQSPAQQWNNAPSAYPAVPQGDAIPGIPSAPGAPGGTSPTQASDPELLALLMGRARQGLAINRNDPLIRQQVDPMTAQMERASRNYINDLAEKGMGRPLNLEGERRMMAERTGQAAGQLESEIIGREVAARRNEIADALGMWKDRLSGEQAISLQRELGYLADRSRDEDRSTTMDQFLRSLAQRQYEFDESNWLNWI